MVISKTALLGLHACMHESLGIVMNHAASMPPDLLTRELAGFGQPTVRDQIAHVISTEAGWIRGLQLLSFQRRDSATLTMDTLREIEKEVMAETVCYLESLTDDQLNTELDRYPAEWVGPPRTPGFIVLHVITHAFHHKGQIVAMMRLLGYPAPDTDMQRG